MHGHLASLLILLECSAPDGLGSTTRSRGHVLTNTGIRTPFLPGRPHPVSPGGDAHLHLTSINELISKAGQNSESGGCVGRKNEGWEPPLWEPPEWLSWLRTQCSVREDAGWIPGLARWVKDPALPWLWLWCRPADAAAIRPRELP